MKYFRLITVILLVYIAIAAAAGSGSITLPLMYENVLANGLKVVSIPMEGRKDLSISLMIRAGRRDEVDEGQEGIAAFLMDFLRKEFLQRNDSLMQTAAMQIESRSGADHSRFTIYGMLKDKKQMMAAVASLMKDVKYNKITAYETYLNCRKKIDYNRAAVDEEISSIVRRDFFGQHPYSHSKYGSPAQLKEQSSDPELINAFLQKNFHPDNAILLIAGGFSNTGDIQLLAEKHFSKWESGYKPRIIPQYPNRTRMDTRTVSRGNFSGNIISFNWRLPDFPRDDLAAAALQVQDRYLFGKFSQMRKYLMTEADLVSDIKTEIFAGRDLWTYRVDITVMDIKDVDFVLRFVKRRLSNESVYPDNADLRRIQDTFHNETLMKSHDPLELSVLLLSRATLKMDIKEYYLNIKELLNLGIYDLRNMDGQYLSPEKSMTLIMTKE